MKIIFFGTSEFAVPTLKEISLSRHKILAVVTAADKRKGRGQVLSFSPVKLFAQKEGLALFQPADLQDAEFVQFLKKEPADLFVVCAYGKILTKELLQIPEKFAINLHASLLPGYRGAAPVNWAIINGESQTGVTVFKMDECIDRGEIILQKKTDISSLDSAVNLGQRLANIGAGAIMQALDLIEQGKAGFASQDKTRVSLAPKLKKEDGLINWQEQALQIHNRIRGLQPWPGAFTYLEDKLLKICQSRVVEGGKDKAPGEIVGIDSKLGILVQTGRAQLLITALQLEGKKKMSAAEFILGYNIEIGKRLGK